MHKKILQVLYNSLGMVCKKVQMSGYLSATEQKITHVYSTKEKIYLTLLIQLNFDQLY